MAGEIFVGSVAVGVVPDLRGFNDKLRVELVPAANRIGEEMGREMSRGIMSGLDIGRIVSESTTKAQVVARKAGYDLGLSYGRAFRRGFELALEGWKPKITVEVSADTLAARAEIDRLGGTVTERIRTTGGGRAGSDVASAIERLISGGSSGRSGGGGGGSSGGGGGIFGGLNALIKALPGGTSGSFGAVPASVGVPAAIAGAVALPFIGQMLAGVVPAVLGGGIAALGVGGALGLPGQMGAQQVGQLQSKATAASDRAAASQAKLNALRQSGTATAAQLTAAEGTLATQQATAATAQDKYQQARQSQLTGSQLQVRNAFENIGINAKQSLAQIGASFVPVMLSIASVAQNTLDHLTPIFATAVKTISGPFKFFSDTLIKSFTSPQVASSIQAVAKAFGAVMTAFTPDIPGIVNSLADAIERISNAVAKNPKAFADFLNFFFQLIIVIFDGIAALANFADYVEQHFLPAVHHFVDFWLQTGHDIEHIWDIMWNNTVGRTERGLHDIASLFDRGRHDVSARVNQTADDTVSIWNIIWNNTIGRAIRGWQDLVRVYHEGINLVMIPVHEALRRFAGWWRENGDEVKQVWHELWAELVAMVRPFIAAFVVIIRGGLYLVKTIFDNVTREIRDVWHFFLGSMRQSLSAFTENMTALWRSWTSTISRIWNFLWGSLLKTIHEYVSLVKAEWNFFAGSFMKSFHEFLTAVVDSWKYTWGIVRTLAHSAWGAIMTLIKTSWDIIVGFITVGLDLLTGHWRKAWNDIKNIVIQVWHNIRDYFAGAGHWLVQAGTDIIQGLLNGMKSAVTGIGSWIKGNIVDPIVNAVKHFFGIHSPAASMVPLGSSLIMGLIKGMLTSAKDMGKFIGSIFGGWPEALAHLIEKSFVDIGKLPAKAIHALAGVAGKIGGFVSNVFRGGPAGAGVERWLPTIKVALMLNNLPDSFAGQVAYQMQTESGGNPNAINLWDINAQRGDPSKGLMQVIGSTFAAYHIPGTSNNIYDPLANIAAAINYAKHVYGPTLGALGSGHGYDQGGWLPPGASLAYNLTGRPELVLTHEQMIGLSRGGDGGTQYIAHFDSLTGAAIESHVRTAYQAMSMTQGNLNRQGRRR